MERAWQATVHGVTKSQTKLSDYHFHLYPKCLEEFLGHSLFSKNKIWILGGTKGAQQYTASPNFTSIITHGREGLRGRNHLGQGVRGWGLQRSLFLVAVFWDTSQSVLSNYNMLLLTIHKNKLKMD